MNRNTDVIFKLSDSGFHYNMFLKLTAAADARCLSSHIADERQLKDESRRQAPAWRVHHTQKT